MKLKLVGAIGMAMLSPFTSRKLWMTLIGLMVVNGLYWTSVWYLYSFTEQWKAELFYKMFASTAWTTMGIIFGYLGLTVLAAGWTNTTMSASSSILQTILEHKDLKADIHQRIDQTITVVRQPKASHFDADDIP